MASKETTQIMPTIMPTSSSNAFDFSWLQQKQSVLNRLNHHAVLLQGSAHIGMTHLAYHYAQTQLCLSAHNGNASSMPTFCGRCSSCHLFRQRTHPDFIELNLGTAIGIDLVHEKLANLYQQPYLGKHKLILIDSEQLTLAASHALLKNMEEPPAFVKFILIKMQDAMLLPTIESRVLTLHISSPTYLEGLSWLKQHSQLPHQAQKLLAHMPLWHSDFDIGLHDTLMQRFFHRLEKNGSLKTSQAMPPLLPFLKIIGEKHPIAPQVLHTIFSVLNAMNLAYAGLSCPVFSEQKIVIEAWVEQNHYTRFQQLWQNALQLNKYPKIALNAKLSLANFFNLYG